MQLKNIFTNTMTNQGCLVLNDCKRILRTTRESKNLPDLCEPCATSNIDEDLMVHNLSFLTSWLSLLIHLHMVNISVCHAFYFLNKTKIYYIIRIIIIIQF